MVLCQGSTVKASYLVSCDTARFARKCCSPLFVSVLFWGSHPDKDNDDCWTGRDFYSKEDAIAFYKRALDSKWCCNSTEYVEIDLSDEDLKAAGIQRLTKNPKFKPSKDDDSDWKRESAMQAGMAFGCIAFNDVMGY